MGTDPKTMYNNLNKKKKNKGSILPFLVVVIIVFLAYKANPEYWQQGRLFQDLKNAGKKEVKTEDIAKVPEKPKEPEVDPDAMLEGSIKGAKTIPINVTKEVNQNDPTYWVYRSKFKTIYLVAQKTNASQNLFNDFNDAIKNEGLKDEFVVSALLYEAKNKKSLCEATIPHNFLCKQCDRKVCIVNPKKREFLVVAATKQAVLGRVKQIARDGWGDE